MICIVNSSSLMLHWMIHLNCVHNDWAFQAICWSSWLYHELYIFLIICSSQQAAMSPLPEAPALLLAASLHLARGGQGGLQGKKGQAFRETLETLMQRKDKYCTQVWKNCFYLPLCLSHVARHRRLWVCSSWVSVPLSLWFLIVNMI